MKNLKKLTALLMAAAMAASLCACNININDGRSRDNGQDNADSAVTDEADAAVTGEATGEAAGTDASVEKNGDVIILFTSDVHCGIDEGFGYAGLKQIRDNYEAQGYTTILVDDGDSIQGDTVGTIGKGEAIIDLMNALEYDVAIPGNHDFDYGMERFLELTEMADFPYVCCNFVYKGEPVFKPYIIKEAAGHKIAFVGVTTPKTITSSTPAYFQDENGEFVYGFCQDVSGQGVYDAVQKAVDEARAEGADYVYVMGHMGLEEDCAPWTYADVIANTNGIDVFLDGHSHDTEQVVMKNKDGEDVPRSAVGYKLNSIGYSIIDENGIKETNILGWSGKKSAPAAFGIHNGIEDMVNEKLNALDEELNEKVAKSSVFLTVNDPEQKDDEGNPIRMIRRGETNMGDLCADAYRLRLGTDVAIMNGGGIRAEIDEGDITYGEIIKVFPFNNQLCVIKVTGQQILDALEWGARVVPDETGAFLQVSGMTYEIDMSVESGCKADENGMCTGIEGDRRVKNVKVGDEPIDPEKTYTLGGIAYTLLNNGDGFTAFDDAELLEKDVMLDNQLLIDYIIETLNGEIGEEYADPYGQGRITIIEESNESEGEN